MVDGAGSVILAGELRDAAQEFEFVERQRLLPLELCRRVGRGEFDLMARIVAKLEQRWLDREAVDPLDEAAPIGATAEFAVGDDLQPDLLLQLHDVADALVLQLARTRHRRSPWRRVAEGLPQHRRPQQTADMIGTERRTALRRRSWHTSPENIFYRSIDESRSPARQNAMASPGGHAAIAASSGIADASDRNERARPAIDPAQRQPAPARAEIIEAAARVFAERGFHGATTQDIADVLGIRQASLYYYFSSKEVALELVCLKGVEGFFETAKAIADAAGRPRENA